MTSETSQGDLLRLSGVWKQYGVTIALGGASLSIAHGEIVGLIGHNGAGKSTLMRIIVGLTKPDRGKVTFAGVDVGAGYTMQMSRGSGIRIAYQELSLAPELKVFENVLISAPSVAGRGWRKRSEVVLLEALDEVFPGHRIPLRQSVDQLSLAQKQMLEITAATLEFGDSFSLLILDEPTSALAQDQAANLFRYLRKLQTRGISTILISHKLTEILGHTDRVVVMRDGKVVSDQPTSELNHDRIVGLMGGVSDGSAARAAGRAVSSATEESLLEVENVGDQQLHGVTLSMKAGEIVGLSGLDGQGQQHLLRYIWARRRSSRGIRVRGRASYVSGDRVTSGVFQLWSVGQNISVGIMRQFSLHGVSHIGRERSVVDEWMSRLAVRGVPRTPIVDLSGGNQQKALIARALASSARVVLLDDPFRGVDIETRQQVYRLLREEASKGRSFLWFTTENAELRECDRVYVMQGGRITAELAGDEITEDAVISASFVRG